MNQETRCSNCHRSREEDDFPKGDLEGWAVFDNDDNVFSYILAGQFKLLSSKKFLKGDVLCNHCLWIMDYKEHLSVTCSNCKKQYMSYCDDSMGYGCSADICENHIDCGFGSAYDDDRLRFTSERPAHLTPGTIICDECIAALIQSGICQAPDLPPGNGYTITCPYPPVKENTPE